MTICLDTSVLIAAERSNQSLPEFLDQYPDDDFVVPAMAAAEFLVGAKFTASQVRRTRAERFYTDYIQDLVEAFDEPQSGQLAAIIADARREGKTIKAYDAAIAACALEMGADVLALDNDFEQIDGLTVLKP